MRAPMDESNPSFPPEHGDPARHGRLSSRIAATPEPAIEAETAFLQQVLEDRLDQGLRAIHQSANALMHEIASEVWRVAGCQELRGQLERVTTQVASAFKALADRDRIIVETVQEEVKGHGELITRETSHVARSMEMYVKEGVNALGLLAGHIDQQVEEMASRDQDVTANVGSAFQGLLGEQVDLLAERLGSEARDIGSSVGAATRAIEEISGTLDARMMGLGRLVRSDSQALHEELNRTAAV